MAVRRGTTTASKNVTTTKPRATSLKGHLAQPATKGAAKSNTVASGSRGSTGSR